MKITYDKITGDYQYPLSKKDVGEIKKVVDGKYLSQIFSIKFGCNTKTTQEGRIVKRGDSYDIKINFCLNDHRSLLLSDDKKHVGQIKSYGGVIDFGKRHICWDLTKAKDYAFYLLLHEISHIAYCDEQMGGIFIGKRTSHQEEQWCDNMATKLLLELHKLQGEN